VSGPAAHPPPSGPDRLVRAAEASGVRDGRVLDALRRVPRESFVPPERIPEAYSDRPIPIPHDQVTTQPSLVAQMVAALRLDGTERVLEVGTGLGFQTAILATLSRRVWSIERFPDLAAAAEANLRTARIGNADVIVGDGTLGLPAAAPFDAIVISAASPRVPDPLAEQVAEGGRLVHPVGPGGDEAVTLFIKEGIDLVPVGLVVPAYFVRLVGRHGLPERQAPR
jgi:protein-L-isoaspartate(D-aspartate) O-methyltransferase